MVTRFLKPVIVLFLLLGGVSCNEEFSPKTDIQEQVVVYAVARVEQVPPSQGFRQTVTVTVMHSFDVRGVNAAGATLNPSIRDAKVWVSGGGRADTLKGRRVPGLDSLTGTGPRWYYSGSDIPAWLTDTDTLTVELADGRRLTARTRVPARREAKTFPDFPGVGMRTPSDPYFYGTAWIFDWSASPGDQDLFFPSLHLVYERMEDSGYVAYEREVPTKLIEKGGAMVPVYPGSMAKSEVEFDFSAMDATMASISEGDPDKGRYRIRVFRWRFTEFDFPLSRYYSSVNGYMDAYSVRLDETVFSNISGGIGVFGSTYSYFTDYAIDPRYAEEFGYATP